MTTQVVSSTVAPSVRSNLTTILGRTAAYTGRKTTWDEMIKANEKLAANLDGAIGRLRLLALLLAGGKREFR